ncbi:MAG: YbaB/EbfC family nucleoid-associated protein [Candidatus Sungbacteria bacterium]|nr:YbaB/EbfC family nucleoid-associated protein [Candidatus Sungbacteria bacterium]
MFDKLKQINQLRQLQNQIKQQRVEVEKNGIRLVMTGEFEVVEISLNPELDAKTQEKLLMQLLNEARTKIQTILAKNFAGQLF